MGRARRRSPRPRAGRSHPGPFDRRQTTRRSRIVPLDPSGVRPVLRSWGRADDPQRRTGLPGVRCGRRDEELLGRAIPGPRSGLRARAPGALPIGAIGLSRPRASSARESSATRCSLPAGRDGAVHATATTDFGFDYTGSSGVAGAVAADKSVSDKLAETDLNMSIPTIERSPARRWALTRHMSVRSASW